MAKHRRAWIVGLAVGIPALAGIAVLVLWLSIGSGGPPPLPRGTRQIPDDWVAGAVEDPHPATPARPEPVTETTLSGTLVFAADGKEFGEETYEIRSSPQDGIRLVSSGTFRFKVVLVTIAVPFSQELTLDAAGRPLSYRLQVDGVLGIGSRLIEITVADGEAKTASGKEETLTPVDTDRLFILGTFGTYALLPLLQKLRPNEETIDVLTPFGAFGTSEEAPTSSLAQMRLERSEEATLRAGDTTLTVERRVVVSDYGTTSLLSAGDEFLGLTASGTDGSLSVYRADFFPRGFDAVNTGG